MSQAIIVVPCYNEASRLDIAAFGAFLAENPRVRFLFVDDGSRDGTHDVLESIRRAHPDRVIVTRLSENVGKAEAVRRGVLLALDLGPEYVGYWDADLATPLDATLTFSAVLDSRPDIDLVFGTRVSLLGRSVERDPVRHYLGRIFATAASLTLGVGFYDTQCGAKLFRTTPEIAAIFRDPFRTRWIFDVEIIARLVAGRRGTARPKVEEIVYEFPLHEWHDIAGSKVKPSDFLKAFFGLLDIRRHYLRPLRRRPPQPALAATHNGPVHGLSPRVPALAERPPLATPSSRSSGRSRIGPRSPRV